ncbi:predicted protein [Uncinocarpus reesii 1704]|uniref:F-box domain-containing protein n=1 Tax=Uncinocarpus reesii (strain UAMH 1704) TaxID=336963 RepID=C4JUJ3_UNCRE|nr:uncharacterized protein UREG_04796 [Uncinocarpus reesii 1704]EEP79954.1 predicted protein [Uncinocarpus reesii 1704]
MFLTDLPTEIVLEIYKYLAVPELLCLALTTKQAHSLWLGLLYDKAIEHDENHVGYPLSLCLAARSKQLRPFKALLERTRTISSEDIPDRTDKGVHLCGMYSCLWDGFTSTLLHVVAEAGEAAMLRLILDRGAHATARDCGGWTPLHCAAWRGNPNVVEMLIDAGALDAPKTPREYALAIAIAQGHYEVVKLLLKHGADVSLPVWGLIPLAAAAKHNEAEIVKLLLDAGGSAPCPFDDNPLETAFEESLQADGVEAFRVLVEAGARGRTPIIKRKAMSCLSKLRILIEFGADVVGLDPSDGTTVLHYLIPRPMVIQLLLETAPELTLMQDKRGRTLLDAVYMAGFRCAEQIPMLLIEAGAAKGSGRAVDEYGNSALHMAARYGHVGVVKALLDADPALALSRNSNGYTPLHFAPTDRLFFREEDVPIKHQSPMKYKYSTGDRALDGISIIKDLYDAGADLSAQTDDGSSALHIALYNRNNPVAITLIDLGIDTGLIDLFGSTALDLAILTGSLPLVRRLSRTKSDSETRTMPRHSSEDR